MAPNNSAPLRHESGTSSKLTPEIQGFLSENSKKFLGKKPRPGIFFGPLPPCILRNFLGPNQECFIIYQLRCFNGVIPNSLKETFFKEMVH